MLEKLTHDTYSFSIGLGGFHLISSNGNGRVDMKAVKGINNANVLVTSVGGLVAPGIIENLRRIPGVSRIVGVDASSDAIGFFMVDKSYVVPRGDENGYMDVLWSIIKAESVNLIIPASDEEVLTLSKYKDSFEEKGIVVLCSPFDITSNAIDKGCMLTFLKERDFPVANFSLPQTKNQLAMGAEELGYPEKPVIVKPRLGRGGRGVVVLKENVEVLHTRGIRELKLEWFLNVIPEDEIPGVVLMEYLPGDEYSVDVLADRGNTLFIVPRKRIKAILGPSQLGEVIWNEEVVNMVVPLVKLFRFDSIVNIQLKYSYDGKPLVTEINPRISGTIVASAAAGVNLLQEGIRHALGLKPSIAPMTKPRPTKMIRYLKEHFEGESQ